MSILLASLLSSYGALWSASFHEAPSLKLVRFITNDQNDFALLEHRSVSRFSRILLFVVDIQLPLATKRL